MKILLLGKNGQVGWELQRALAPLGDVIALDRQGTDGLCGDLTNLQGLAATVRILTPHIIVNAAAYTAVDKAESEQDLAVLINGDAPGVLAREAAALGAWLIHYSTDYVFDGSGDSQWQENAPTGPLSVYGRSKLMGEQAIQASGAKALVLRTSWVYAAKGNNFAKTMLRLASERDSLNVVADQYGAPTGAELIADVTAHMLHRVLVIRTRRSWAAFIIWLQPVKRHGMALPGSFWNMPSATGCSLRSRPTRSARFLQKRIHCPRRVRTIRGWL